MRLLKRPRLEREYSRDAVECYKDHAPIFSIKKPARGKNQIMGLIKEHSPNMHASPPAFMTLSRLLYF